MDIALENAANGVQSPISSASTHSDSVDSDMDSVMSDAENEALFSGPTLQPFNSSDPMNIGTNNVCTKQFELFPSLQPLVTTTVTNGDLATCNVSNVSELSVSSLHSFTTTITNVDVGRSNADNAVESPSPLLHAKAPRQHSIKAVNDPRNVTDFREDQATWSWENLPDILYTFKPPNIGKQPEPATMSYEIHGQFLRDLPILPDNISSDVEEFRVEAWARLDRRVRLVDITQRMHPEFRIKPNALQQRGVRFRKAFNMLAWGVGNKKTLETESELIKVMVARGINPGANSTREITPGFICPEAGEAGGRIALPEQYGKRQSPATQAAIRPNNTVPVNRGAGDAGDGRGVASFFEEAIEACLWKAIDMGLATPQTIFDLGMEAYAARDEIMMAMRGKEIF
ncbi:hypothetical protein Plec18167_001915 [Paecilomyces lecythidis]|uniref:Uncharacterized protein n=1 Tax=Paecilomyces lecythidis TaxID=3004212 RepID=A0ABR3YAW1_9EURO